MAPRTHPNFILNIVIFFNSIVVIHSNTHQVTRLLPANARRTIPIHARVFVVVYRSNVRS